MNKIKHISAFFRIFFIMIAVALPLIQIIGWMLAPGELSFLNHMISFQVIPSSYAVMHQLSSLERFSGFVVSIIPLGISLLILYFLIKLFRLYERGDIFSVKHVIYIRNIGYALLIGQLLNPIYQLLMGLVLTLRNPPGHRVMSITLDQTNIGILLVALLLILVSWIMMEGCKLNEEQQLTI